MNTLSDLDYVEMYAKKLKTDNSLFVQQKMLIESQLESSKSMFKSFFTDKSLKEARKYLKQIGLL